MESIEVSSAEVIAGIKSAHNAMWFPMSRKLIALGFQYPHFDTNPRFHKLTVCFRDIGLYINGGEGGQLKNTVVLETFALLSHFMAQYPGLFAELDAMAIICAEYVLQSAGYDTSCEGVDDVTVSACMPECEGIAALPH